MTTTQLGFLGISTLQFIANTVQQLHITLVRILLQCGDESPTHGSGRLTSDIRILTSLSVLAATPHDDIRWTRLGLFGTLVVGVAGGGFFEESHGSAGDAADIAAGVRGDHGEETGAGFFEQVGFLEHALSGVDVGEVEGGARMAGVEDGGEATPRGEAFDHDAMHLVVNDVALAAEVDGVDDLVIAVFFIAVEIGGLPTVAGVVEEEGVVGTGVFDEPMHGAEDVGFSRLRHGVVLVVGQGDHVFSSIAEALVEVCGHVFDIVDAAA